MKQKIIKLSTVVLLFAFISAGCQKENEPGFSEPVEGYIVGSFRCWALNENGQGTSKLTPRGYCILLEGSDNANSQWGPMDYYSFNLPDNMFNFPEEILRDLNGYTCGPWFFPDSLRTKYKIRFRYRKVDEKEKMDFICGACIPLHPSFKWEEFYQIVLKDVSVINP